MNNNLIPIERKSGVTLYGRIISTGGKLGQFEVHSDWARYDGLVYNQYADAERRMSAVIGVHHGKAKVE